MIRSVGFLPIAGGVTLAAFASGFGVCLFNLDTVGQCLALANSWVDVFREMGDNIILWAVKIFHGAMGHKP